MVLKAGNTSFWKRAQWGQDTEAYSIIVTLAVGEPSDMSSAVAASPAGF